MIHFFSGKIWIPYLKNNVGVLEMTISLLIVTNAATLENIRGQSPKWMLPASKIVILLFSYN